MATLRHRSLLTNKPAWLLAVNAAVMEHFAGRADLSAADLEDVAEIVNKTVCVEGYKGNLRSVVQTKRVKDGDEIVLHVFRNMLPVETFYLK